MNPAECIIIFAKDYSEGIQTTKNGEVLRPTSARNFRERWIAVGDVPVESYYIKGRVRVSFCGETHGTRHKV